MIVSSRQKGTQPYIHMYPPDALRFCSFLASLPSPIFHLFFPPGSFSSYKVKYGGFTSFSKIVIKYPMIKYEVTMAAGHLPPEPYFTARFPFIVARVTASILRFVRVTIFLMFVLHYTVSFIMAGTNLECAPSVWHNPSTQAFRKYLLSECSCGFSPLSPESYTDSNLQPIIMLIETV